MLTGGLNSAIGVTWRCLCIPQVWRLTMERDVVCGMQVDPAKSAGTTEYKGRTYYFCSQGCKTRFDAAPSQFNQIEPPAQGLR
jgi:YHS domain-containing protein